MVLSPLAGALSDRIGRRPIMVTGLSLQALGFIWVASHGSLATSWIQLDIALLIAGIGISMALPTVPTAVFSHEGWKQENEFMNGCSTNWASYLMSLKSGAEGYGFNPYPGGEISRWGMSFGMR
jgi:MFS family permease